MQVFKYTSSYISWQQIFVYCISCIFSQFPIDTSFHKQYYDRTYIHISQRPAWDLGIGGKDKSKDDRDF